MSDLWYKDAVIYCLDVETFHDGNGDGIGDFKGLLDRLDHLTRLGVSCLWLLPFYPTPNRDNGYDVIDYYSVDRRLGTPGEFVELVREARERGIRIMVDLVVNHTSKEHPWFQEARSDPESRYRDWYIWEDEKPDDADEGVIFPGVQDSIWSYDRKAKAWYLHRFYHHQPDLNMANPEVREEVRKIMGFWLELGVSGFRLDAAPFLVELKGVEREASEDPFDYLSEFRDFLSWRKGDAVLLAEANVPPERVGDYFGEGRKLHMLFNFLLNQHLFLALARQEAAHLVHGFHRPPRASGEDQWVHFLRNHDELDLGRLSEAQRQEVFEAFAPDENMRLYGRGIRRRLAPMLDGDPARIRMANSLLLSLPGTPVIRYGQEIGMGEDLSLSERDAVRTTMQWSDGKHGGFSDAPADELVRPAIASGPFGYEEVNVESQKKDPDSLLRWMARAIRVRRETKAFGRGRWRIHDTDHPAVFAHSCRDERVTMLALHNLAGEAAEVRVDLSHLEGSRLVPRLGSDQESPIEEGRSELDLEPWGYRWYAVEG